MDILLEVTTTTVNYSNTLFAIAAIIAASGASLTGLLYVAGWRMGNHG